jgi:hypothetical protein
MNFDRDCVCQFILANSGSAWQRRNLKENQQSDNDRGCRCYFDLCHILRQRNQYGFMAISTDPILLCLLAAKRLI